MGIFETLILSCSLAMDASAVSMTNGMTDCKMPVKRALLIGAFFGFFQFLMPVIGYFLTDLVAGAFQATFEKIAAWVSFGLLLFLGGKMILDCVLEWRKSKKCEDVDEAKLAEGKTCERLPIAKLFTQAIATSIDALAVGVTLCMKAVSGELPLGVWWSTGMIGVVTFALSVGAVYIGKAIGDKLAGKATLFGGVVLVILAVKMLF